VVLDLARQYKTEKFKIMAIKEIREVEDNVRVSEKRENSLQT
jgi:hypothetical protein